MRQFARGAAIKKHKYNFKCGICNDLVNSTEWSMHKKVRHIGFEEIEQGCEFCDYKTIYGQNFRLHVKNNHNQNSGKLIHTGRRQRKYKYNFKCGICNDTVNSTEWLMKEPNCLCK